MNATATESVQKEGEQAVGSNHTIEGVPGRPGDGTDHLQDVSPLQRGPRLEHLPMPARCPAAPMIERRVHHGGRQTPIGKAAPEHGTHLRDHLNIPAAAAAMGGDI